MWLAWGTCPSWTHRSHHLVILPSMLTTKGASQSVLPTSTTISSRAWCIKLSGEPNSELRFSFDAVQRLSLSAMPMKKAWAALSAGEVRLVNYAPSQADLGMDADRIRKTQKTQRNANGSCEWAEKWIVAWHEPELLGTIAAWSENM